jgi:hypothetical protein
MPLRVWKDDDERYPWASYAFDWYWGSYIVQDRRPSLEGTLTFFAQELVAGKLSIDETVDAMAEVVGLWSGRLWNDRQW